jgi:hypothetical protein
MLKVRFFVNDFAVNPDSSYTRCCPDWARNMRLGAMIVSKP